MAENEGPHGEIVFYRTDDGRTRIECRFQDGSIWLTQAEIAELYQTTPQNVTLHLKAIYAEGEIDDATCKDYLQVRSEGTREVRRTLRHYSLPAVLAVGYRVRSARGSQFRQWATERLPEYVTKGFAMDEERLKNPPGPGVPDYFDTFIDIMAHAVRFGKPRQSIYTDKLSGVRLHRCQARNYSKVPFVKCHKRHAKPKRLRRAHGIERSDAVSEPQRCKLNGCAPHVVVRWPEHLRAANHPGDFPGLRHRTRCERDFKRRNARNERWF